ncbi:MAG: MarR family winged helix-turn-helix transcriptional regulator [Minisyncoccia bacterium]
MKNVHEPSSVARAATLLFRVRGQMRSRLAQGKRLDPYQWLRIETLVYIRDHEGCSMKDIATHLSITAPSATSVVDGLMRLRLLERRADPADKRVMRLYLSRAGRAKLKRAVARGTRLLGGLFATLSPTELTKFTRLLGRIEEGSRGASV